MVTVALMPRIVEQAAKLHLAPARRQVHQLQHQLLHQLHLLHQLLHQRQRHQDSRSALMELAEVQLATRVKGQRTG